MLSSESETEGAGTEATPLSSRSSTPSTSGRGSVGRPRKSLVWDYFIYDSTSNKSICQVSSEASSDTEATSSASICGHRINGKFTTNLRSHLKSSHSNCYKELVTKEELAKEEERRGKADKGLVGPVKQRKLTEVIQRKYEKTSTQWQDVTRKMALFIASSNVPNSIVENAEFQLLIESLDPRYQMPGRARMAKEMDLLMADMKGRIKVYLDFAQKVSVCTDIWTKRGMTSSYLGVTTHFFSRHDHRRHCVTLAVRVFPHPHTAERVRNLLDEILKEWGIDEKLYLVITDNGSNMVKAFQSDVLASIADSSEESMDEEEDVDEASDDDDSADEAVEGEEDEESEFDIKELQHDIAFAQFGKRLGCFAHSIQLVVQKFKDDTLKPLMKKVHALVKKVNKSSRATGILLSLCRKKLVSNVPTRWSSTFLMLDRLIDVKGPLGMALEQLEWDNLAHSEWKTIESIHRLLKPFAQYTALTSAEESTTLPSVLPILMELQLHLREMVQVPEIALVATTLQSELKHRFRKYTDPGDECYEPLYVVATILDPRYKPLINAVQMKAGKDELLRMLKANNGQSDSQSSTQSSPARLQEEEGPVKKRQRFSYLSKVIEDKLRQGKEKAAKQPPGEQELERYMESMPSLGDDDDPLAFWVEQKDFYPLLSALAVDIMSIPGSSAPVERIFSTAGEATTGKRNRLSHNNLEREILIRKNKKYMYTS